MLQRMKSVYVVDYNYVKAESDIGNTVCLIK